MQSNFEQRAANERVDAVERRWARQDEIRRRNERRATLRRWTMYAVLALAALAVAGGAWIWTGHKLSYGILDDALEDLFRRRSLNTAERARIDDFSASLKQFDVPELRLWKEASKRIRPRNAASGLVYRMLIAKKGGGSGLYEMVADGRGGLSVEEITPLGIPQKVTLAEFNRRKAGEVYLILCEGKVYVAGADDVESGRRLYLKIASPGS